MSTTELHPDDARRFYVLMPARGDETAADRAPLALARRLADSTGGQAHAVVAGPASAQAVAAAREQGVDHIWTIADGEAAAQPHQLAQLYASALRTADLAAGLDGALLLVAARPDHEEFAGRLAACLDVAPLGRCLDVEIDARGLVVRRRAYGGRLDIRLSCAARPAIASFRQGSAQAPSAGALSARKAVEHRIETGIRMPAPCTIATVPRTEPHAGLEGARVVVSGGRGMGDESGFPLLYALADRLGGAVGASLPAVDAGWAPVARQVGQSGRYVSPDIYLAIGISGTPQHVAGIDPHTRIVAVNRDPDAPIFGVAQVGAVADWQTLVPELLAALGDAA